ncbi:HNH endonuclease signature motif containing protein [Bordetella hinzii]|uniref:HNH endonuclease signature motif containing protein n=1 Tax=Bordetella hinzii TaxID=103855 RepID=UPI00114EC397|nr:HNH endonuclease signature motif containing protein [Bordetella hinzii]
MQEKACSKCGVVKSLDQFHKASKEPLGVRSRCKLCVRQDGKAYRENNPERRKQTTREYHVRNAATINAKSAQWYAENKERAKKTRADWREKNFDKWRADVSQYQALHKEHLAQRQKEWAKANRSQLAEKQARRVAAVVRATPPWADLARINQFYADVAFMRSATGIAYEVDHIVPLQSDIVCGLHCEENLQVLTAKENKVKHNTQWPDMP